MICITTGLALCFGVSGHKKGNAPWAINESRTAPATGSVTICFILSFRKRDTLVSSTYQSDEGKRKRFDLRAHPWPVLRGGAIDL